VRTRIGCLIAHDRRFDFRGIHDTQAECRLIHEVPAAVDVQVVERADVLEVRIDRNRAVHRSQVTPEQGSREVAQRPGRALNPTNLGYRSSLRSVATGRTEDAYALRDWEGRVALELVGQVVVHVAGEVELA